MSYKMLDCVIHVQTGRKASLARGPCPHVASSTLKKMAQTKRQCFLKGSLPINEQSAKEQPTPTDHPPLPETLKLSILV